MGLLPSHRMPTEHEWESSGYTRKGWPVIGPDESLRDHPGFDKMIVLAISPQVLEGRLIGTVDPTDLLGVDGPKHPDRCNDTIAGVVAADPDRFIGFASVNPAFRGVDAAVEELERPVVELGLAGVKLYPMYQHWAVNDPELAFPLYAKAEELGIPVMIHQAGSTRIDAKLELGRPAMLDDIGREFRRLRVIIAHCGTPLGRRGALPPDEASELLHRALVPDRHADTPRPLPAAVALRADVRAARRNCSSGPTIRASFTTRWRCATS